MSDTRIIFTVILFLAFTPLIAEARAINQFDVGHPPAARADSQPLGFRSAQGWYVYWGSTCADAEGIVVMWVKNCSINRTINFLSRRKLEILERSGFKGANYLPEPFFSGNMKYNESGKLAEFSLFFKTSDTDQISGFLHRTFGIEVDSDYLWSGIDIIPRDWKIGDVHLSVSPIDLDSKHAEIKFTYKSALLDAR